MARKAKKLVVQIILCDAEVDDDVILLIASASAISNAQIVARDRVPTNIGHQQFKLFNSDSRWPTASGPAASSPHI